MDKNFEEYSIYVKMFSAVEAGSIIQIRTLLSEQPEGKQRRRVHRCGWIKRQMSNFFNLCSDDSYYTHKVMRKRKWSHFLLLNKDYKFIIS